MVPLTAVCKTVGFVKSGSCLVERYHHHPPCLGLKVFMDARSTVTAKEGDRYSLRPPKFIAGNQVIGQSHKLGPGCSSPYPQPIQFHELKLSVTLVHGIVYVYRCGTFH